MMLTVEEAPPTLAASSPNVLAVCLTVKERVGTDTEGKPVYQGLVLEYRRELEWRRQ